MNKEPTVVNQERNIPIELLETEILPRLPVESLLRFKVVSKQWLAIFSNPQFTKLHLHRSVSSQHSNILVDTFDNSLYLLNHADHRMLKPNQDLISRGGLGSKIELIDSSNGLICLINRIENRLCFFNPATGVCREVICPKGIYLLVSSCLFAFGYSIGNDEYKFLYVRTIGVSNEKAHVYTLRSNDDVHNWKELSVDLRPYYWPSRTLGSVINEKAHWIVSRQQTCGRGLVILTFDLTNETFTEVSLPQDIVATMLRSDGTYICDFFIADIEQNLSVCCQRRKVFDVRVEVWMMMKYGVSESWSRTYKFDLDFGQTPLREIVMRCNLSVSTRKEGRSFFLLSTYGDLLVKDLNARQARNVEVFGPNNAAKSIRRHVDSLVSPFLL